MNKIKKIEVAKGLFWIEIADIDVRIMCGAPADSVKHLIKKGFILSTETGGAAHESGPNMILLSDIMMQNSQFSNLAEFPVLQMLYKQCMIIPNHPNNNGTKPLLIGDKEQVDIQLDYIYRGNYGLVTKEELLAAGATKELADEIMNMKLKFAFGKMVDSDKLLDRLYIDDFIDHEIKDGLIIKRVDINIFEFTYKDESVIVDLNLQPKETYDAPYFLGNSNINREYFSIIHTGEGDGWDTNRPCMGSIITFQGKIYLLDAGPNITETLKSLGISVNEIDGIFMTHAHDDHFAGITSLIQSDHKINFYASSIVRASIFKKLSLLLTLVDKNINNFFEVHDLELDVWNEIDGLEVKPILSPHPIETNIYYFRTYTNSGYKSYAHLADLTSFDTMKGMISEDGIGITQEFFDKTCNNYLMQVDIKKVDIGGGMIHGIVEDFVGDKSSQLVLSHTSQRLTDKQKQLGSSAPFGTIDILIRAEQDFNYKYASDYLSAYFPSAPQHAIKMLLNYKIKTFNPQSIIIKENEINKYIYIILTGNVEMIQVKYDIYNTLSAGAMIGTISGMLEIESNETYRADGYINALEIPAAHFYYFIKQYGLAANIEYTQDRLDFLQSTNLFGEFISYKVLGEIINSMREITFKSDKDILLNSKNLFIIRSGSVKKYCHGELVATVGEGGFFNYSYIIFEENDALTYTFDEDVSAYEFDKDVIKKIPVVYSKLYESYKKEKCSLKIANV